MVGKMVLKNVEMQLEGKDVVLLVLTKSEYSEKIVELARIVSGRNRGICYVSVNKPAKALSKAFAEQKIDTKNFRFIDCISRTAFDNSVKKEGGDRTVFISSPGNLTELSINLSASISREIKDVFVDALSTFLIYAEGIAVIRFAHNLITRLRECGGRGYFVVLKNDISGALLDDLSMFSDGVIEV